MVTSGPRVERHLAAIFAADVAGYSSLMSQDEVGTLRTLTAHRDIMDELVQEHGGRIANTAGDSVLAEFPSAVDAVQCAVEVQKRLPDLDPAGDPDRALRFRIGIHVGDVMVRGADLLGDGVNVCGSAGGDRRARRCVHLWRGLRAGPSGAPILPSRISARKNSRTSTGWSRPTLFRSRASVLRGRASPPRPRPSTIVRRSVREA